MFCGKYTIVEKFRVNLVGKAKVERWGLFLNLVKKVKLINIRGVWIKVWWLIEKDGTCIVWRVWWLEEENGTYGASGFFLHKYLIQNSPSQK